MSDGRNNRYTLSHLLMAAVLSASLSFGASQLFIVGEVKQHSIEIANLKESIKEESERTDKRIFELAGLVKETIQQNRELIAALKAARNN